jgi:putative transposase
MIYNPYIHKRKSLRLKNYDYSNEWLYFITICIKNGLNLLGEIKDDEMILYDSGKMIEECWLELEERFQNIKLHNYVVMPNHFHWIIEIIDNGNNGGYNRDTHEGHPYEGDENNDENIVGAIPCGCPISKAENTHKGHPYRAILYGCPNNPNLWNIIGWFKSISTNKYIDNVKKNNRQTFPWKLWHTNYYEHIIRNEKSYLKITEYIENNPRKWIEDKLYKKNN